MNLKSEFHADGLSVDYTPGGNVTAGTPVQIGGRAGMASVFVGPELVELRPRTERLVVPERGQHFHVVFQAWLGKIEPGRLRRITIHTRCHLSKRRGNR